MFTNFFGRVKNPCGDCVNGECTMNCSGTEPAPIEPDSGSMHVIYEKDGNVTVTVRSPYSDIRSAITLPLTDFRLLIGGRRAGEPSALVGSPPK